MKNNQRNHIGMFM